MKVKRRLRIQGLRKRWLINSIGPIFMVAVLGVVVFSISIANYYYTSMRNGLEAKANEATDAFNSYAMNSYNEFYQMANLYVTDTYQDQNIELQFIDSNGRILVSTYGVTAGLMPGTPDIVTALDEGSMDAYMGADPTTGQIILAVSPLWNLTAGWWGPCGMSPAWSGPTARSW